MRPLRKAFAGVLFGALLLTGCGADGDTGARAASPSPTASAGTFPVTVSAGNGAVTIPKRPERVVSLSPTATETLFAIGAGPQVVAVDDQSNHPPQAPKTDLSGFKPNAEAIIAQRPDLVVLSDDMDNIVAELTKVKVPVLLEGSALKLDDAYDQITDLGAATGNTAAAGKLAADVKGEIERLAAAAPASTKKLTFYHEVDKSLFSTTSNTFIGQIYTLFGLENIADKAPDASGGYPKLSAEFIADADPDLIFLADVKCCGQSAETVAKRPGWGDLTAVKNDSVIALDDDIASRWGPRIVDLAKTLAAAREAALDKNADKAGAKAGS
ncbi:iron complex transport system substrate-binding protein [Sinosporangium album]|uniref:Iron complex transport system substrate-binding protein n=1 Tax=Sinosporangium album TaxID=504805 RepID=A0A1G7SDK8_9ACTN|nr:ABC transporter substrate-binding protein [Sinosporangium album]SDG21051.1 iron complex transport system substrate-binding protein [Sinosporangium album]